VRGKEKIGLGKVDQVGVGYALGQCPARSPGTGQCSSDHTRILNRFFGNQAVGTSRFRRQIRDLLQHAVRHANLRHVLFYAITGDFASAGSGHRVVQFPGLQGAERLHHGRQVTPTCEGRCA